MFSYHKLDYELLSTSTPGLRRINSGKQCRGIPLEEQSTAVIGVSREKAKRKKEKLICDRGKPLHHAGQVIRQVLRCARVLPSNGNTPHVGHLFIL
nr:unnamed protein product [Timema tahoe]